ncbi:MAG: hypothetical protein IH991_22880, partial [Planctomycetes bacterium]|nr:hypothetical protein [Planctomycetota bacterium]
MSKRGVLISLVVAAMGGSVVHGQATIHVPADAQTIQIAIQQAQPFDTILVAPGTYFEAINYMGKVIVIQSSSPNDPATVANTIIDAGGLGIVVTFAGTEGDVHTALDGFTITGGTTGVDGNRTLAAIRNCIIRDNSLYGIDEVDGDITNCEVLSNSAGIVSCHGTISLCFVEDNNGAGMSDCDGFLTECVVTRNAGIGVQSCDGQVERCLISNNESHGVQSSNASFKQCIISGNVGNGLRSCRGTLIENSLIAGNRNHGFESCSLGVLNCTLIGNAGWGFVNHTGAIKHAIIWTNTAGALHNSTTPILSGTANPFFVQPGHLDVINNVWIDG